MPSIKSIIKRIPMLGPVSVAIWRAVRPRRKFPGSAKYWEKRYSRGGNSGPGSYDQLAEFKARFLNRFVERKQVGSVIEFGCGDGNQLTLAQYPAYIGFDISEAAVEKCRERFRGDATKSFRNVAQYAGERADLSMSLDVVYHLVEDEVFESYMNRLCDSASKWVIVYSSNDESLNARYSSDYILHRRFTDWVAANKPEWRLVEKVVNQFPFDPNDPNNTSLADFYVFERVG